MELDELGIDIEAQNCLDQIQQESRTSADYDPSQGMTGEELHNFCKFLYSQIQSKDEEISRLTANIKELTDEVRLSRLQQQTYNDENKAVSASHSHKLDVVLQQLQETRQELTDTKRKLKTAETLMARNQRNLNPESLITLRKTETLVKELREHQLLRQYIMVLLVRVVLIISIQLVRRLSISAI